MQSPKTPVFQKPMRKLSFDNPPVCEETPVSSDSAAQCASVSAKADLSLRWGASSSSASGQADMLLSPSTMSDYSSDASASAASSDSARKNRRFASPKRPSNEPTSPLKFSPRVVGTSPLSRRIGDLPQVPQTARGQMTQIKIGRAGDTLQSELDKINSRVGSTVAQAQ